MEEYGFKAICCFICSVLSIVLIVVRDAQYIKPMGYTILLIINIVAAIWFFVWGIYYCKKNKEIK